MAYEGTPRQAPMSRAWQHAIKIRPIRFHRIVGRCRRCRMTVAWIRSLWERYHGGLAGALAVAGPSLFENISERNAADDLAVLGYYAGLCLPPRYVAEILRFARETPCFHAKRDDERFFIADVRDGRSPAGHTVAVADVDLTHPCHAIDQVACDAALVRTARRYFGYTPTRVIKRLYWSPVSGLADEARRCNGQTVDFHYDIDPAPALYAFFYITGADARSGAHVVIPRTHQAKPLSIVFSSCFQSDERLARFYPDARPTIVAGPPGFGFVEDPASFHKAIAPVSRDRLILQLRYS